MRRALVVTVVVAIAGALPVAANAADWKGVVVAKDPSRSAVVTASRTGVIRTVRIATGLRAIRVGQRVAVHARSLSDGTFSTRAVRILGSASTARIRAVVVQTKALRTTVSAGGTVFALRGLGAARRVQSAEESLEPGDRIVADVSVDDGSLEVDEIEEVGHTVSVKLEGHFVSLTNGVLELRVGDDVVHVTIPDGVLLPDLLPGAEISIRAAVGEDGGFTAREVWLDDDPPAEPGEDDESDGDESDGDEPDRAAPGEEPGSGEHADEPGPAEHEESEPEHADEGEQAGEGDHSESGEPAGDETDEEDGAEPGQKEGDEGDGEPADEGGSEGGQEPGGGGDVEPDGEGGDPEI